MVVRGRRRHLRLAREHDQADTQVVRCLVEEQAQSLLRCAEARRLDVLGLHGARGVDDEDDRRLLAHEAPLDVRAREPDDERTEADHEDRRRHEAQPRPPGDHRRENVEIGVANRVARAAPLGPEPEPDERRDDEQAEQHPGALEAHAALVHSACT